MSLRVGHQGLMPLDNSIVFDGAWRLLNGQAPYVDFITPNGLVPMVMQAAVFAIGGVSWTSYVFHAACMNGACAVIVFLTLRGAGMPSAAAWSYGGLAAVVVYAPIGTPYMDQHAFVFLAGVFGVVSAAVVGGSTTWAWAIPVLVALGGLSKQVPTVFAPLIVAIPLFTLAPDRRRHFLRQLGAGSLAVVGLLLLMAWLIGVEWELVRRFAIDLPAATGRERWAAILEEDWSVHAARVPGIFRATGFDALWSTAVFWSLPAAMVAGVLLGGAEPRRRILGLATLGVLAFAATYGFLRLTFNNTPNGYALVPLAFGFAHAVWLQVLREWWHDRAALPRYRLAAAACSIAVVATVVPQGLAFWDRVVRTRLVNDMVFEADHDCGAWPSALRGLVWSVPARGATSCAEFEALVGYLKAAPRPLWVMGDTTVLYAVTHQVSPMPAVFLHPGLTVPPAGPDRDQFEDWLSRNLAQRNVRRVVRELPHTKMHVSLDDFPRAAAVVAESMCGDTTFGRYQVIELCGTPRWLGPRGPGDQQ